VVPSQATQDEGKRGVGDRTVASARYSALGDTGGGKLLAGA